MGKQRELKQRQHNLMEVRNIMNSMKTLAYMETHKVESFLPPIQAMVENVQLVATNYVCAFPNMESQISAANELPRIVILVGSERGFCGDINQSILERYHHFLADARNSIDEPFRSPKQDVQPPLHATLITLVIGAKLVSALQELSASFEAFDGASVSEEIESVLLTVIDTIVGLQKDHPHLSLTVIHHDPDSGVQESQLLPPFATLVKSQNHCVEPLLYMEKTRFLAALGAHFVYVNLQKILFDSFMLENKQRVSHLQSAVNRLDESLEIVKKRINSQRQEEIIEEIEVILLSDGSFIRR